MIATAKAALALLGDAMIAAGVLLRERFDTPYPQPAPYFDDNDSIPAPAIPLPDVRAALDELADSELLAIAATVIAGWSPILLKGTGDHTDVDVLVDVLRDRANQFRAIEADADHPYLTPEHLHAHLTDSPNRGE